ncbi:ABC transporter ATP-binding protein [Streptomyces rubiginosohelvolus]|uniref:ABC transporter ATP-binding protein n=1 Tax=Streptomyces rubiginosohelvolus TaxID=67362 RepID=UPI00367F781F
MTDTAAEATDSAPDAATGAPVIRTRGLTKRYRGGQLAVDGLDLTVPAGSVFGFLGPNGSGKTTTIRMLMGLIDPTSGTAEVLGRPMPEAARTVLPEVGALIEGPALYGFLNGRDNLLRYDRADPTADPRTRRARVGTALERVGLAAASGKKAKAYSLGMKQRLGLAAALLRPRRLLVLDEPTNGLDPQGMREIRLLVRELAAEGTTVFLSSHLLDEIEQVCTHAAVMARGRLVRAGLTALVVAVSLTGFAAIGLFVSTLTGSGIGAMAATVGLLITVQILDSIPQLSGVHPYLFAHYWMSFADVLREPVYWDDLSKNFQLQGLYVAVFGSAAWARFTAKDITA